MKDKILAQYEWTLSSNEEMDLLLRDGVRVGEVSPMGQLWVSTVFRPSSLQSGEVDENLAIRSAVSGREKARTMTMENARFVWDAIPTRELKI